MFLLTPESRLHNTIIKAKTMNNQANSFRYILVSLSFPSTHSKDLLAIVTLYCVLYFGHKPWKLSVVTSAHTSRLMTSDDPLCGSLHYLRGCIPKFPDWPPGAKTANSTALCHEVQLNHYFMSQSSTFCRHNTLCCFSTCVYCCTRIFRYRLSPETFRYTLVCPSCHLT
jgi:hypothetical protein